MSHRVRVINRLEIPGNFLFSGLDNLLFLSINELLYLRCFLHDAIEPIDTGDVGAKIEAKRWIDAQESCDCDGVVIVDQKGMLLGWTAVLHNFDLRAGHSSFDAGFDLFEGFHRELQKLEEL